MPANEANFLENATCAELATAFKAQYKVDVDLPIAALENGDGVQSRERVFDVPKAFALPVPFSMCENCPLKLTAAPISLFHEPCWPTSQRIPASGSAETAPRHVVELCRLSLLKFSLAKVCALVLWQQGVL